MNHGYAAWRKGRCTCELCHTLYRRHLKRYRLITGATGRAGQPVPNPLTVPGDVVREHLARLIGSGWTVRDLADATGLTRNRIGEIRRGYKSSRLQRATADRILTLDPLTPVDLDPVVVDRLVAAPLVADWRALGATKAERLEALRRLDTRPQRAALRALGYGDQQIDLPPFDRIRVWLGIPSRDVPPLRQEAS